MSGDFEWFTAGIDGEILGRETVFCRRSIVNPELELAIKATDQEIYVTVGVPVDRRKKAAERLIVLLLLRARSDRSVGLILKCDRAGEFTVLESAEEMAVAGVIGIGDEIPIPIRIEIDKRAWLPMQQ